MLGHFKIIIIGNQGIWFFPPTKTCVFISHGPGVLAIILLVASDGNPIDATFQISKQGNLMAQVTGNLD